MVRGVQAEFSKVGCEGGFKQLLQLGNMVRRGVQAFITVAKQWCVGGIKHLSQWGNNGA